MKLKDLKDKCHRDLLYVLQLIKDHNLFQEFQFETLGKLLILKHDEQIIKIQLKKGVNNIVLFKVILKNIYVGYNKKIMSERQFYFTSFTLLFRNLYILQLELNEYKKFSVQQWVVIKKRNIFIINLYSMLYKLCKNNVKIITNDIGFWIQRKNIRVLVGVFKSKFTFYGKEFVSSKDLLNSIINFI